MLDITVGLRRKFGLTFLCQILFETKLSSGHDGNAVWACMNIGFHKIEIGIRVWQIGLRLKTIAGESI